MAPPSNQISNPLSASGGHLVRPRYRSDIDGLRGLAVLSVVGFHTFPGIFKGGFIGVDVFFVISGFLISSIIIENLGRDTFSFAEFYFRRIRRIFPALIVVLVATYAIGWFVLLAEEYKQLGRHIAGGAGFISNFLLWQDSGYFDRGADAKPLLHLWSLGVEEQFYIVWPLLLYLAWKRRVVLVVTLAIVAISFALNVWEVRSDAIAAFYSPATRMWEILAGAVLAYISSSRPGDALRKRKDLHALASIAGVLLIGAPLFLLSKDRLFPGWWALLPVIGAYLLIAAGSEATANRKILSHPVLVWFGLVSYPLYLWHWPLLSFVIVSAPSGHLLEMRIAAVLISIALAWLTYALVEKPIRFGTFGGSKVVALCTLMITTAFIGYNAYRLDGWSDRFNTAMSDEELVIQRGRYWNKASGQAFDRNFTNIIVFGDSQAVDVVEALSHDPRLRTRLFPSDLTCSAFFNASKDDEKDRDACRKSFDALLSSAEIHSADVLIYAHYWRSEVEERADYAEAIKEIRRRNDRLRIYFFGHKPLLGSQWISINGITRSHRGRVGMNDFLESTKIIPESENIYAKSLAKDLGVGFVDVSEIFCRGGCPFYEDNKFSYFDQNHWTEVGAARFFARLVATSEYEQLVTKPQ